ncbi:MULTISPECIES: universal stress protein [unclassified Kribbella]|uniref:universal stress protein n=1 Tax=unclassified Kribbella TaxID=2644121 RepID=UPI0030168FBD
MTGGNPKFVVVGIDETAESQLALRWAVAAAEARGLGVRVVRAYLNQAVQWPAIGAEGYVPAPPVDEFQAQLDTAVAYVRDRLGYDAGSGWLAYESPAEAILSEAAHAELVVLGSRVHHRLQAAVLGSVVTSVTARATCPVVVVKGEAHDGPIVIGTDGSEDSEAALEFAFEEAARSHAPLSVVYCWQPFDRHYRAVEDTETLLRNWLAESLEPLRAKFPAVAVRAEVVHGRPAATLAERSSGASLAIVGSRGRGGVRGLLLGSVSQSLLHSAACPVAVVRHRKEER